MKKSIFWILLIGICLGFGIWFLGFGLGGCSSNQPLPENTTLAIITTTVAEGATTTTTISTASGISGMVSWDWSGFNPSDRWGKLLICLWTVEDFTDKDLIATENLLPAYKLLDVASGETSAGFNFSSPGGPLKASAASTSTEYYLLAILYVGRNASLVITNQGFNFPQAITGDKVGQFSNGNLPIAFGGTTSAAAINYSGTPITNLIFSLNGTWPAATTTPTTTTSTVTETTTTTTTTTLSPLYNFDKLFFLNQNIGWVGGPDMYGYIHPEIVFKTTNEGITWNAYETGIISPLGLKDMYFVDSNTGWAVGDVGTIIKTSDGGATWETLTSGTFKGLSSVCFASSSLGWAVGRDGTILKTSNGGMNWSPQNAGVTSNLYDVQFINTNVGWVTGYGTIIQTTDEGTTWTKQISNANQNLNALHFLNQDLGWVAGDSGTIFKTIDGGTNWTSKESGYSGLQDICFVNSNEGWAVGAGNTIIKTTNGGTTWTSQESGSSYSQFKKVKFLTPQNGWAVGFYLFKTTNGGNNWEQVPLP